MSWVAVAAGVVAGATSGGTSASARNRSIKSGFRINQETAIAQMTQQQRVYNLQLTRARRDEARTQGLVAVSSAERGVGSGGSTLALDRNVAIDADLNENALEIERYGAESQTLAELRLAQHGLKAQGQSIAMSMLSGAIGGASTGLSIGQGVKGLSK